MPVKNICQCELPPGGQTICEPHQLAVCSVSNGVANKQCIDPPVTDSALALCNWAISVVTGINRMPNDAISFDGIQILESGHCVIGDQSITFSLPYSVKAALIELNHKGQEDSTFLEHE